jgi:hypothetical protein
VIQLIERNETVSTVEIAADRPTTVVPVPRVSIWTRMKLRMSSWGRALKTGAGRVGNWFTRGAKWLYNTKAVQWIVASSKSVGRWTVNMLKGPVGWVAAPVAAVIFAPKAVAVMLLLTMVTTGVLAFSVYKLYRHLREVSPEEVREFIAEARDLVEPMEHSLSAEMDAPINPDETTDERHHYLDEQHLLATDQGDIGLMSELLGRMTLLEVRDQGLFHDGDDNLKLKKDASPSVVHRACRRKAEKDFPKVKFNWGRMYNGVRAEDARLREVARLKAEQANLTIV